MATDFIPALDAEIAALEEGLAADPRYLKLRELRRVRELYTGNRPTDDLVARPRSNPLLRQRRAPSTHRQKILDHAKEFLRGRTEPTTTAMIFDAINPVVEIPGENPRNNLSAMLSNSPEFSSHGRAGWTLASETTEAADNPLFRAVSAASFSVCLTSR
jgi:hypothetical protein